MTTENHKKFTEHLKESTKALFIVAHYFHHHGFTIRINGQKCSPTASSHEKYADDGDLFIQTKDDEWIRIEVKGLNAEFTNLNDWPFKNFMVCAKHSYDKTLPDPPTCYYILNKTRTHAALVKTNTFDHWFTKTVKDGRYENVSQEFYHCPLDKIEWRKIKI
tara:strand:+ start:96 stop:581 length:486 start_codon:yes stop_codon:yes gene_type:complete